MKLRTLVALSFCLTLGLTARSAATVGVIFVTTTQQKIDSTIPGCSLQEAIYASKFHLNLAIAGYDRVGSTSRVIQTECTPGTGNDIIVLPTGKQLFQMDHDVEDQDNPTGPTANPIIDGVAGQDLHIVILANGAIFQKAAVTVPSTCPPLPNIDLNCQVIPFFRLFAVGPHGHLDLRNADIQGFMAHGGNGSAGGGGGGMGAGGAIYVMGGSLVVSSTTFEGNGAIGGDGGSGSQSHDFFKGGVGGGGGGIGGNGGPFDFDGNFIDEVGRNTVCMSSGGGGSRGHGEVTRAVPDTGIFGGFDCQGDENGNSIGGGGGGNIFPPYPNTDSGGFDCGGGGGHGGDSGQDAPCQGGGGGGGSESAFSSGNGGKGNYGGGGGGGADKGGNGGNGGFGGGGGGGSSGFFGGTTGGTGGFGGGGGAGPDGTIGGGNRGPGGMFGGGGSSNSGGGGAGLGGAIFNDGGGVRVTNSTFFNNFAVRGVGGDSGTDNGADAGGAIFSNNGHLTVVYSTIFHNQTTGSGGGVVVLQSDTNIDTLFVLKNAIIFKNGSIDANDNLAEGDNECSMLQGSIAVDMAANIIQNNDNCQGVISADDPQLAALSDNGGLTPTMAIPNTSPAFNAATDVGVTIDQRGMPRPSMGGFDIGAFELCLDRFGQPCIIPAGNNPGFPDFTIGPVSDISFDGTSLSYSEPVPVNSIAAFSAPVNLSVSQQVGFSATVAPTPVTPPSDGTINSTLTINITSLPAIGTYTFTITGTSGALTHSADMHFIIAALNFNIMVAVNTLEAQGCIDSAGIAAALNSKLNASQNSATGGQLHAAVNALGAFMNQVQAQAGKHIATTCTIGGNTFNPVSLLIADARAVIGSFETNSSTNPILGYVVNGANAGVSGAIVSLLDTGGTTVATATTDATGFYFFAQTDSLISGSQYSVVVNGAVSTPPSQSFSWSANPVTLTTFVVQ